MRSPRPAARIMARISASRAHGFERRQHLPVDEGVQELQLAVTLAHGPHVVQRARNVVQVTRLAIAVPQAREDADRLEMALHAHQVEPAQELALARTDLDACRPGRRTKLQGPCAHSLRWPRDIAVTQQRNEIVGDRSADGVLEIEDARVLAVSRAVADHEIARVVVAMDEDTRLL